MSRHSPRQILFFRVLLIAVSMAAVAPAKSTMPEAGAGMTPVTPTATPSKPIATQEQLDSYLRDTPSSRSPFRALTPGGQRRFFASLVFHEQGLGGFETDDLRYDLTRDQAFALLRLFDEQAFAIGMDARNTPLPDSERHASGKLESRYDALLKAGEKGDENATHILIRQYGSEFAAYQTDSQRRTLGDRDMEFLFRAANMSLGRTGNAAYLADMRADFDELDRRHVAERPVISDFYDALIRTHRTDEARALLASHRQLDRESPPVMRSGHVAKGEPSLWIANAGKRELLRLRFNVRAPAQIVVFAGTGCHFCHIAAGDLEREPLLRDIFREYGQWVADSEDITAFDAVRQWNNDYPDMRLGIAYGDNELPTLKHQGTPTFFFLEHGAVVATVVGWPDKGNIDAIRDGLRKIDLLR
jgi:hypothetical protein